MSQTKDGLLLGINSRYDLRSSLCSSASHALIDNLNQYTAVGGVTRTYDTKGNLTGDNGNTYGYDVESRLKTFSKTGTTASYTYDAFNRRVSKTVNGTATFYVYDGDDIIEERNSAGTLVADYVHGDQTDEPLTMTRGTTTYYYFSDGLGSIRQLTNSAGAVQQTYDYNSYGKLAAAPTVVNPFTFTGREYDTESGNYYYRARYYSPTLGRFLQRDPIGYYDSMNLYQYVGNNPLNYKDPYGLQAAPAVPIIIWITILVLVFTGYKTIQTCPPQQIPVFEWQSFVIPLLIFGGGGLPIFPTIHSESGSGGAEHTKGKRNSTKGKHEEGRARKKRDQQREEGGDENRPLPRKRPLGHKGPYPPPGFSTW